jgi:hypothetical protein
MKCQKHYFQFSKNFWYMQDIQYDCIEQAELKFEAATW